MTRVLVVDDSTFLREHVAKLLSDHGYQVVTAEDGEQALDVYQAAKPDIVLMDITMPHMNGMDALVCLRTRDAHARVIILTALDQKLLAAHAVHMGAKEFLVKPVPPGKLLLALERALR